MSEICPTKYREEQKGGPFPKVIPTWSLKNGLRDQMPRKLSEIQLPTPYPSNRRKPGVTLPTLGGIKPFKIMLKENCPDMQKEEVKSLKEIDPRVPNGKVKTSKKGKKK